MASRYQRGLVLTFDAFGTLFTPRFHIAKHYGDIARQLGLKGFRDEDVGESFLKAFKSEQKARPNYGREEGMKVEDWWGNVITQTFTPFVPSASLPSTLVPRLLSCFSSSEGYTLYADVPPLFQLLRKLKTTSATTTINTPTYTPIIIGVITNSDSRVSLVLESLGLQVRTRAPDPKILDVQDKEVPGQRIQGLEELTGSQTGNRVPPPDIDMLILSYDVRTSKPDKEIFRKAMETAHLLAGSEEDGEKLALTLRDREQMREGWTYLHVGDEYDKDYVGAKEAGWQSILLDREGSFEGKNGLERIGDLRELDRWLRFDRA
ncbi:MAG: hypothetical protein M1834_002269 [Cirrosporium novae-zelandiae]|nr:MAG: hypothetical protein M1834_002269 [Cirrosporium novae-zelandiae]